MIYNIIMKVRLEAKNKDELGYILIESFAANEMDEVNITNNEGISLSLQGITKEVITHEKKRHKS